MTKHDDTLKDLNRRDIAFPEYKVNEVIPEFFQTEYPKLVTLLNKYYDFEDSDQSPSRLINELFYSRDITQTDLTLLSYIEDELLLGEQYFEGFANKREAAKFSNQLYKSKGTKYGIEQFFRMFFGIDPDVVYTKNQVFKVGGGGDYAKVERDALLDQGVEAYGQLDSDGARTRFQNYIADNYTPTSKIGPQSDRYITNNKLYQTFAINVKAPIPLADWIEEYRLFAHPAGMFIGAETQIVTEATDLLTAPLVVAEDPPPIVISETALFGPIAVRSDLTTLVDDLSVDSDGILSRINVEKVNLKTLQTFSLEQVNNQYGSLREAQIATSPTFDDTDPLDATTPIVNSATAANTFTKTGDATVTSDKSKFGEGSLLLDGTGGDGLLSDNSVDIYDSDKSGQDKNKYTVEMWIQTPDVTQIAYLYDNWVSGSTRQPIYINNNKLILTVNAGSSANINLNLVANTWAHLAYVKDGAAWYIYKDGSLLQSGVASAGAGTNYSGTYAIGRAKDQTSTLGFNGYIDEFRLSDSALYTGASFTLQTAEYPGTDSSTIDLLHFGAEPNGVGMDFSNDFPFETMDQDRHVFYSSDSDQYLLNLGHLTS